MANSQVRVALHQFLNYKLNWITSYNTNWTTSQHIAMATTQIWVASLQSYHCKLDNCFIYIKIFNPDMLHNIMEPRPTQIQRDYLQTTGNFNNEI